MGCSWQSRGQRFWEEHRNLSPPRLTLLLWLQFQGLQCRHRFSPRVVIGTPWLAKNKCPYMTSEGSRVLRKNHPAFSPSEVYAALEAHSLLSHFSADKSCTTCCVSCGLLCTLQLSTGESPGICFLTVYPTRPS